LKAKRFYRDKKQVIDTDNQNGNAEINGFFAAAGDYRQRRAEQNKYETREGQSQFFVISMISGVGSIPSFRSESISAVNSVCSYLWFFAYFCAAFGCAKFNVIK